VVEPGRGSWPARGLAIVMTAGAVFFGARLLRTEPQLVAEGGVRYLVARRGIAAYQVITGADIRWMENGVLPKGAFEHPEFLVGRVASHALASGQVIREEDFAGPPGTQAGVSSGLRPDRVAGVIPLARVPGAQELLKPDDLVDLLATRSTPGGAESRRIVTQARVISVSPPVDVADLSVSHHAEPRGLLGFVDQMQGQLPSIGGAAGAPDTSGWLVLELRPAEAVELTRWPQLSVLLHGKQAGAAKDDAGLLDAVELIEGSQPRLVVPESM
jgi:Flp pilus assembly protein CpaB